MNKYDNYPILDEDNALPKYTVKVILNRDELKSKKGNISIINELKNIHATLEEKIIQIIASYGYEELQLGGKENGKKISN